MYQHLSPDELLTTTRSVRKRLDFSRPVEREMIQECLAIAQQGEPLSGDLVVDFYPVSGKLRHVVTSGLLSTSIICS